MLYLSRIRLARNPATKALAPLLSPAHRPLRLSAQHSLLWSVFSDGPDRRRDFLWREERSGDFFTLSSRPPVQTDLFEPHQVREFAPDLAPGDRLAFRLRCNATRTEKSGVTTDSGKERKRHVDLVMDALYQIPGRRDLPAGEESRRARERLKLAQEVGREWLSRQGARAGFRTLLVETTDYMTVALPGFRGARKGQPRFGVLDLAGRIEVTDPALFLSQLAIGFGRAKAFGCGLMLIRRAL